MSYYDHREMSLSRRSRDGRCGGQTRNRTGYNQFGNQRRDRNQRNQYDTRYYDQYDTQYDNQYRGARDGGFRGGG